MRTDLQWAHNVTCAWSAWLAADGRQRDELYRCYVCALIEEALAAAELERALRLGTVPGS